VVSLLSCINAVQLFCSRILYAMSVDGLFFRSVARVNKGGTPEIALLLSTITAVLFVLGSFERVIAMLSFFFVADYTLTYISVFVLRKKEPAMHRPYHAWGYPWTTAIALLLSVLFLIGSLVPDMGDVFRALFVIRDFHRFFHISEYTPAELALGMLLLSYPVYRILKWGAARRPLTR
jgi:APA family basic amino acid/polyamine antiporter